MAINKKRKRIRLFWLKLGILCLLLLLVCFAGYSLALQSLTDANIGDEVDSLDGVAVYYNGKIGNTAGRNLAPDGYNLGLKWQCVEFVKRYYYEHYNHKMPDSYGHAYSFFNDTLPHGAFNKQRGLYQYHNGNNVKPQKGDLIIMSPTVFNSYGHVAIIAKVDADYVTIIQQNPGPVQSSRETFKLTQEGDNWRIDNNRIWGWLRKADSESITVTP